jgi:hypothetical protein
MTFLFRLYELKRQTILCGFNASAGRASSRTAIEKIDDKSSTISYALKMAKKNPPGYDLPFIIQ